MSYFPSLCVVLNFVPAGPCDLPGASPFGGGDRGGL